MPSIQESKRRPTDAELSLTDTKRQRHTKTRADDSGRTIDEPERVCSGAKTELVDDRYGVAAAVAENVGVDMPPSQALGLPGSMHPRLLET